MTVQAVRDQLIPELERLLGKEAIEFTKDADFIEDLGCDEMDRIEVVMTAEELFDIAIDDDVADELTTVGKLVDHIAKVTK